MRRAYQVQREQLTDRQWADFCRFMEFSRLVAQRARERRAAAAGERRPALR